MTEQTSLTATAQPTFTPSKRIPRAGRPLTPAWVRYNKLLKSPPLLDGNWHDLDLDGLSFEYARKKAINSGFTTSKTPEGVLMVKWKGQRRTS